MSLIRPTRNEVRENYLCARNSNNSAFAFLPA